MGPLVVSSGDGPLDLGAPTQRALLAVLLTSPNSPVSDDLLVEELWGEAAPPSAHHLVHVYVSRLRALMRNQGDGHRITHDAAGYTLHVQPGELDADTFVRRVAEGRALADSNPSAAEAAIAEAMQLWRGTPFGDLVDSPPLVSHEVERLRRLRREARQSLIEIRMYLRQHRMVVRDLLEIVAEEPYDESAHAQLMLALYRSGQQADALEVYTLLRARLRDELGIDPSPEVEAMHRRVLLQDPTLLPGPPQSPSNLPARLTAFIGRRSELREVADLLLTNRLVTLTGPGGVGKTRLAIEVADRRRELCPGGVVWVDLSRVHDPERLVHEFADVVRVTPAPGTSLADAVVRSIARRPALLVIDNCEQFAGGVAVLLTAILNSSSLIHALATSRVPLLVEGERLWTVPPLGLPDPGSPPERLAESDAVRLFVDRGRTADPLFELDAENADVVAQVCRRLDGISLAIELAAARLAELTPAEIARHLDTRFEVLQQPALNNHGRHRTMEAAIDASHALLTPEERRFFERVSVFAGSFDEDAASAVCRGQGPASRSAGDLLGSLVAASMLTTGRELDGQPTRYRQLETIRDYGLKRLRSRGEEEAARHLHAAYYLDLCAQAGEAVDTPAFATWVERLTADYSEVVQALEWSFEHEKRTHALRAAGALREFWYRTGNADEAARWSSRMLEGDVDLLPARDLADVYNACAFACDLAFDLDGAFNATEQAIRLAHSSGNRSAEAFALFGRANLSLALGDLDSVARSARQAITACDEAGDRLARARPLSVLGYATLFGGSPTEARTLFEEALSLHRELGDRGSVVVMGLVPLVTATLHQGDLEAAEAYATEAIEVGTGTRWEAAAFVQYSAVLATMGDIASAETSATRGLRLALDGGLTIWAHMAILEMARVNAGTHRIDEAARLCGRLTRDGLSPVLDRLVYKQVEADCRRQLGNETFEQLAAQGARMTDIELEELTGVR